MNWIETSFLEDNIFLIKINKPKTLNSLDKELLQELNVVVDSISNDDHIHFIIISGVGKSFVAGADIKEMSLLSKTEALEFAKLGSSIFRKIETLNKITIAAINGYAIGGGCELAMSCDFRIATNKAKFSQPEVSLGIIPGFSGTQRLTRIVGLTRAKQIILSGKQIDVNEALTIGLINSISQQETLIENCIEFIKDLNKNSFPALLLAKKSIQEGIDCSLDKGIAIENNYFSSCFETSEQKERMKRFIER